MNENTAKRDRTALFIIIFLLIIITVLCINNSSALAAAFGWAVPAGTSSSVQPNPLKKNNTDQVATIPSINTFQRSHISSQSSGHLDDSSEIAKTPDYSMANTTKYSPTSNQSVQSSTISGKFSALKPQSRALESILTKDVTSKPQPKPAAIPITDISLNSTEVSLKKGGTAALAATVSPANTTQNKTVSWTSTNQRIAAVDGSGKVTAVGGGAATIIASTSNGKTATCTVTVTVPAISITLNLTDISLDKGDSRMITAMVNPADTTEKVVWSTSDGKVAVVDSTGNVTAREPGSAIITATVGSVKATCRVSVGISISRVILSDRQITLKKGDSKTLTAWVDPPDTTEDTSITWLTSDSKIATVDQDGNVKAVEGGKAIITAKAGTHTAQCTVNVIVPVTGMTLSDTNVERGKAKTITPIFEPSDATDRAATWTSSDESVATVDATGKVSGLKIGKTTITAVSHDGGFSAQCKVDVVIPVTGISLDQSSMTIKKGETPKLAATISPANATDKAVTWTSSDSSVASVDDTGNITAVEGGSAIITVKTHDGGYTSQCIATVIVPVTGITLEKTSLSLALGSTATLKTSLQPDDATDTKILWTSSNPDIVAVDDSGNLSALSFGQAVITATSHDGGFTAQCSVTVDIPVTGISLDRTSLNLGINGQKKLTAAITPDNATDRNVLWSSSDERVATVDKDGLVTAHKIGDAAITAKSEDGGYTSTCSVSVIIPVTSVKLDQTAFNLLKGSHYALKTTVTPINATKKNIQWESSDPSIATVDSNGRITAVSDGTATITATALGSIDNIKAQCTITVVDTVHFTAINIDSGSYDIPEPYPGVGYFKTEEYISSKQSDVDISIKPGDSEGNDLVLSFDAYFEANQMTVKYDNSLLTNFRVGQNQLINSVKFIADTSSKVSANEFYMWGWVYWSNLSFNNGNIVPVFVPMTGKPKPYV
jgi:uncharacterized protein YjdB